MDVSYYERFPCVLREALKKEEVSFLKDGIEPIMDFESFHAYRGIFRTGEEKTFDDITEKDFKSFAEAGRKWSPRICREKIRFYSCSVYTELSDIKAALKFPQEDRRIAYGPVDAKNGCVYFGKFDSHVDWWLYEKHTNFWKDFRILNYE